MAECSARKLSAETCQLIHIDGTREDARSGLFGDDDTQHGLLALAQLGTLGDEAQPAKVDVGARHDRYKVHLLADEVVLLDPLLRARDAECA